jgi:hypothetical protein
MVAGDEPVIRDVVGIKTELNQNLCDPEVVGSGVENAIQRVPSQICSSEAILVAEVLMHCQSLGRQSSGGIDIS